MVAKTSKQVQANAVLDVEEEKKELLAEIKTQAEEIIAAAKAEAG